MRNLFIASTILFFLSCATKQTADLIIYNAVIYTVDTGFTVKEAMAIKNGKIIATGKSDDLTKQYEARELMDMQGKAIYPGLIDAHAHFFNYGLNLQTADLVGTQSWNEILEKLKTFAAT